MSLILDALKKSEEKRQLGQAPTLGSSILSTRPRRNMLPYIVAAIVLVALIGLWQFNKYKHSHRSKAAVVAGAQPAPATALPALSNRTQTANSAGVAAVTPTTTPAAAITPPVASAAAPSSLVFGGKKPAAAPTIAPKAPALAATPIAAPAAAVAAAPKTALQPAAPTTTSVAPVTPVAPLPATPAGPDNNRVPAPAVAANPDAKPIQAYYELPFPVRKDLPAIKISMHVYAVDPAQRFIVVNNVHQGEGDSIEGGVTVREIRPTDIVLEFQGKIFSVPRTGI